LLAHVADHRLGASKALAVEHGHHGDLGPEAAAVAAAGEERVAAGALVAADPRGMAAAQLLPPVVGGVVLEAAELDRLVVEAEQAAERSVRVHDSTLGVIEADGVG